MKTRLYTYSETRATFPFVLDRRGNVLYLAKSQEGIQFVTQIPLQGGEIRGDEEIIRTKKIIPASQGTILILSVLVGAIDIKISKNIAAGKSETVAKLKKIKQDTQIVISLVEEGVYSIEITPLVKTKVYLIKQLF